MQEDTKPDDDAPAEQQQAELRRFAFDDSEVGYEAGQVHPTIAQALRPLEPPPRATTSGSPWSNTPPEMRTVIAVLRDVRIEEYACLSLFTAIARQIHNHGLLRIERWGEVSALLQKAQSVLVAGLRHDAEQLSKGIVTQSEYERQLVRQIENMRRGVMPEQDVAPYRGGNE